MKAAVAFLTTDHNLRPVCEFAQKAFLASVMSNSQIDFYVFDDGSNEFKIIPNSLYSEYPGLTIIRLSDDMCFEKGYKNAQCVPRKTHIQKQVVALDKCFYYFTESQIDSAISYDFVWVFEDDCFIPDPVAILNLANKYSQYDLVVPSHKYKSDEVMDWHWKSIKEKIGRPWFHSMICAFGASRNMMNAIKRYVNLNKTLFFAEAMMNTIAHHNGLKVFCAEELRTIVWQGEWGLDDFLLKPNNIFHPMKNIEQHEVIRKLMHLSQDHGYLPANKLPNFVKQSLY